MSLSMQLPLHGLSCGVGENSPELGKQNSGHFTFCQHRKKLLNQLRHVELSFLNLTGVEISL